MVLPLIVGGGVAMAGGTAMSMIGTHQRDKAVRAAQDAYRLAARRKFKQDQLALGQEQRALTGLGQERQNGIGSFLSDLASAQKPTTDEGFADRQTGVLTDIGKMSPEGDGSYAYDGAPRGDSEATQGALTGLSNTRMAEALQADWEQKQIQGKETSAKHRLALGDLLRGVKGSNQGKRFQLAKALRELDWAKKVAALQGQMDDAQRKGKWLTTLGGLSTQLGGMGMTAGLAGLGGAGAAAGAGAAGAYGATPDLPTGADPLGYPDQQFSPMSYDE
jgi:hypothetical protein